MYNKTVTDWLQETKDDAVALVTLRWIEIVATVLFFIGMSGGRKQWLNLIHIFGFIDSVMCLVAPNFYLSLYFEGTPDHAHLTLMQMASFLILCWILCYWLLLKSTDSTTETSILLSYTVLSCLVFLAMAYPLMHPSKKPAAVRMSERMKVPMFYVELLVVTGSLYFYLSAKDWGGYGEVKSHANFHLRMEFIMLMVMGLMMYALPQWIVRLMTNIEKLDSMHAFLARVCGSILLAMSLMSGRAANFLRDESKDAVVISHLLFYLIVMVTSCISSVQLWNELSWKQMAVRTVHHCILVFNAAGALDLDPNVFKRVVLPRIKAIPNDVRSCLKWKTR